MGSYWAKVVSYPKLVAPGKSMNIVLDWEAGYGEWLVPNAEVFFRFKLASEVLLETAVIKADGPGTFSVTIPETVVEGEELNITIEYVDNDLVNDDLLQSLIVKTVVDGEASEGGDDVEEDDDGAGGALTDGWAAKLEDFVKKWAMWLTIGLIGVSVLIMYFKTGGIDWSIVVMELILGVAAWAIVKYWTKFWYVAGAMYVAMPVLAFLSDKISPYISKAVGLVSGGLGGL